MKIESHSGGARLVKRRRNGKCYAAVWPKDTTDKQVESSIFQGEAAFFPFDESTGQFDWNRASNDKFIRPIHFRR